MKALITESKDYCIYQTLRDLEEKKQFYTQGKHITDEQFREWVKKSEKSPVISIVEAKRRWVEKKKKFLNNID